jgi:hypothetical protein
MSQTHFIHCHTTSEILLTTKEYFSSQWSFLPSLVCAQNCLVTAVLTVVLSPYVAEIIQVQNEFPVRERWSSNTLGYHNEAEGHASLGEGVPSTTWNYPGQAPKLLDVRSPETAGATTEEMDNCLGRRVCRQIVS